jgi:hypothetical protein
MSIFDAYVSDKPSCFYKIDDPGTTYPNLAGDSRALVASVASDKSSNTPIVVGSDGPVKVGGTKTLKIPSGALAPTTRNNPASLECWVVPSMGGGPTNILSHPGEDDGLTFDGESIKFTVNFENSDPAVAQFFAPDFLSRYHLVGVYDTQKVSLYVNGLVVDEVDLTDDQLANTLASVSEENFYAGDTSNSETMLLDAPAIYDHALSPNQVLNHFIAGSSVRTVVDNVMSFGGQAFVFDDMYREVVYDQHLDLTTGVFEDATNKDGVRPDVDDTGLSLPGVWTTSIPVALTENADLAGVKLDWFSDGYFDIEASLDYGTTWDAVENGKLIPGTEGLDATDKEIDIRVTFTGSIQNDPSVIRDIYAVAYLDHEVRSVNSNRTITIPTDASTSTIASAPIEAYQNAGLDLGQSVATVNSDDSDDPQTIQTIEVWFKLNSNSAGDILPGLHWTGSALTMTGGTLYLNGSSSALTPGIGEWVHAVIVLSSASNVDMDLGGADLQIGMLALYNSALSANQISRLYTSYFGAPKIIIDEPSVIGVQEQADSYFLYDFDWQIISGGR